MGKFKTDLYKSYGGRCGEDIDITAVKEKVSCHAGRPWFKRRDKMRTCVDSCKCVNSD